MRGTGRVLVSIGVLVGGLGGWAMDAEAIPAFARKYHTACVTCHEAFPRLNATGEAFRLNGFKFANDETYIKDEPVSLGAEAYKKVWPDAIWPGNIPGMPPVALRLVSDFNADLGGASGTDTSFEMPQHVQLLYAGALGDRLSAFIQFEWEEGEVSAGGWLQLHDIVGPDHLFNLRVGRVGAREFGLATAANDNRFTVNDYLYGSWQLPYPASWGGGATNGFSVSEEQPGIELNGFGDCWRYAVGVVNGTPEIADNNSAKDFYGQLSVKIGGMGFDGSGGPENKDGLPSSPGGSWVDNSLILSSFGYVGAARIDDPNGVTSTDDFFRAGFGALWRWQDLQVDAAAVWGNNENPYGTLDENSVASFSWHLGAHYFIFPWWIAAMRYEALSLDLPDIADLQGSGRDRIVIANKFLVRANVSVTAEARLATFDHRFAHNDDDDAFVLRLDFAF